MKMNLLDTLTSFLQGFNVPGVDRLASTKYDLVELSPQQLQIMYRGDWVARKLVDIPPADMTREWRNWKADNDQIEKLEEVEKKFSLKLKYREVMNKARLYGGAVFVLGIEGQQNEPLDVEVVKKEGLKFLHVLHKHELSWGPLIADPFSPWYGEPEWYQRSTIRPAETPISIYDHIHPSRIIKFIGAEKPDRIIEGDPFGDSVLQIADNAIRSSGLVTQSIAQLISEAKTDIIKMPDLAVAFSTEEGRENITKRYSQSTLSRSLLNTLLIDSEEEWERVNVNFSGMPEVLQMYLMIVCASADIPTTRFLGRSPQGLNATGESDVRNYYDRLKSDQTELPTDVLDEIIIRTTFGTRDPDIYYEWAPLWQLSDAEKAEIALNKSKVVQADQTTGLLPLSALAKARQNQLVEDGFYPGLESALQDAEDQGEQLMLEEQKQAQKEMMQQGQPLSLKSPFGGPASSGGGPGGGPPSGNKPKPTGKGGGGGNNSPFDSMSLAVVDFGTYEEGKHPRVRGGPGGGQFTSKPDTEKVNQQANNLIEKIKADGGFTFNVIDDKAPKPGDKAYVLSPYKDREKTLDAETLTLNDFASYIMSNLDALSQPGHYFGGWYNRDDGNVYLDTSIVVSDPEEARALCQEHKQLAYFDMEKMETVSVDQEDKFKEKMKDESCIITFGGKQWPRTIIKRYLDFVREDHWSPADAGGIAGGTADVGTSARRSAEIEDVVPWEENKHPRVSAGQSGGGRFASKGGSQAPSENEAQNKQQKIELDPEAVEVGGDAWNKETAIRLETEYKTKLPEIEATVDQIVSGGGVTGYAPKLSDLDANSLHIINYYMKNIGKENLSDEEKLAFFYENSKEFFYPKVMGAIGFSMAEKGETSELANQAWNSYYDKSMSEVDKDTNNKTWSQIKTDWDEMSSLQKATWLADNDLKTLKKLQNYAETGIDPTASPLPEDQDDDEEDNFYVPESWNELSADQQEETFNKWKSANLPDFQQSEIDNWYESGDASIAALTQIETDFNDKDKKYDTDDDKYSWFDDAVENVRNEIDIPYTNEQLWKAIEIQRDKDYDTDPKNVYFDDSMLQEPDGAPSIEEQKKQINLPGFEEVDYSSHLTEDMRKKLTKEILKSEDSYKEKLSSDLEPPEYLKDSAEEGMSEYWDGMDNDFKFKQAEDFEVFEKEPPKKIAPEGLESSAVSSALSIKLPEKFDPLADEDTSQNYKYTQKIAQELSCRRAMAVIKERGIKDDVKRSDVLDAISTLWGDWKSSSTSENGLLIQLVASEEFGGRFHDDRLPRDMTREDLRVNAKSAFRNIGGYDGVRALMRGTWESTQYLLDKSDKDSLKLYRGIRIEHEHESKQDERGYRRITDMKILRNGAASTSVSRRVANDWVNGTGAVMRFDVPRTAVLSVPAYGINVHSEREVVIMGTAWRGWDIWAGKAPPTEDIPVATVIGAKSEDLNKKVKTNA